MESKEFESFTLIKYDTRREIKLNLCSMSISRATVKQCEGSS